MKPLENDIIRLRAPEPEDLDRFYKWENDTSLWERGGVYAPLSRYEIKQFISGTKDIYETRQLRFTIEKKTGGELIGAIDLYDFDPHNSRAAISIIIDRNYHRQGFGIAALGLLVDYSYKCLGLHQLYVHIPVSNEASIRLFEKYGFAGSGYFADWLKIGDDYETVRFFSLILGREGS
ncbi:MAG: GNAT family N-acetyltransferase [Tannerella sp.]|jgi:diamine N-acetyltransferase|nr:GNAT family N-acetyltransferase [Tannerella sp.]